MEKISKLFLVAVLLMTKSARYKKLSNATQKLYLLIQAAHFVTIIKE